MNVSVPPGPLANRNTFSYIGWAATNAAAQAAGSGTVSMKTGCGDPIADR